MGDWLGTGYVASSKRQRRSFFEAREFARSLKLRTAKQWEDYCDGKIKSHSPLPLDIPKAPQNSFKDEWVSFADWLGYEDRKQEPMDFVLAREFVRKLHLNSVSEWVSYCEDGHPEFGTKPANIPYNPDRTYKYMGWIGYGDWLGTGSVPTKSKIFYDFESARLYVRKLKLRNSNEWKALCRGELAGHEKLPNFIPTNPHRTYKAQGWISYLDWMGI